MELQVLDSICSKLLKKDNVWRFKERGRKNPKSIMRKSSLMIHERHGNLKYKYSNRNFWCRGYYVDTAGKNTKKIAQYIQNKLKEDQIHDQMTMREYQNPFTDSKQQFFRTRQISYAP